MATREWFGLVFFVVAGWYVWPLLVGLRHWMCSQRDTAKIVAHEVARDWRRRRIGS